MKKEEEEGGGEGEGEGGGEGEGKGEGDWSWGIEPKPPAAWLGRKNNTFFARSFVSVFTC